MRKYPALGAVATIYQVVGVAIFGLAVFAAALSVLSPFISPPLRYQADPLANPALLINVLAAGATLFGGVIVGLGWYAIGELFHLLRDVEYNTRSTAEAARENAAYSRELVAWFRQNAQRRAQQAMNRPPQVIQPPLTHN